jgi:uroporphyrinogen-III synthase
LALRAALHAGQIDLLTFTSPSAAENLLDSVGDDALRAPVAAIGPVTAEAATRLGYRVAAVADPHTVEGLLAAVTRHLGVPGGDRGTSLSDAGGAA